MSAALAMCLTLAASLAQAAAAPSRTLTVFAAASLSDAFKEVGQVMEQRTPGLQVRFQFAGSPTLATQIDQGAAADVFASADMPWMMHLRDRALLAGDWSMFARNRLIVIVPRTNPARMRRLQDLARPGIKLVLGAASLPVGNYSRIMLGLLSRDPAFGADFATRVLRNVVSEEDNVKSVAGKVQLGEADAGIVYRSDVTSAVARFIKVFEIPENANVLATYPMAVLRDAKQPEDARAFVALVLSSEGQKILQRHGLVPVGPTAP